MRRGSTRAWWGASVVLAVGCTEVVEPPVLEQQLVDYFAQQGVTVESVRCAEALARTAGSTVECGAQVDGEHVALAMVVTDEDRPPRVTPQQPTLVTAQIEPEIVQSLRAQGRPVSSVRCEGRLWVVQAGQERRCEVVEDDGRRLRWIGTFTGEGSAHRARVEPWPSPAGEAP